jgi:hypothetical protein
VEPRFKCNTVKDISETFASGFKPELFYGCLINNLNNFLDFTIRELGETSPPRQETPLTSVGVLDHARQPSAPQMVSDQVPITAGPERRPQGKFLDFTGP